MREPCGSGQSHRSSDGGRRADVTVRPCSLFALCSVLVILTCVPLHVRLKRKVLSRVTHLHFHIFHKGLSWNVQSILGKGLTPVGKEKDEARQAVFLTPTNPFGDDLEEEEPHDDFTVPQNAFYVTKWKDKQNAVYWVRLSKAQDQGLEF